LAEKMRELAAKEKECAELREQNAEYEETNAKLRSKIAKQDKIIATLKEEKDELDKRLMRSLKMLHEVREQLKRISEIAERKGLGKEVQGIMAEAGLKERMDDPEWTCFDRLYQDAIRRQEKYKRMEMKRMNYVGVENQNAGGGIGASGEGKHDPLGLNQDPEGDGQAGPYPYLLRGSARPNGGSPFSRGNGTAPRTPDRSASAGAMACPHCGWSPSMAIDTRRTPSPPRPFGGGGLFRGPSKLDLGMGLEIQPMAGGAPGTSGPSQQQRPWDLGGVERGGDSIQARGDGARPSMAQTEFQFQPGGARLRGRPPGAAGAPEDGRSAPRPVHQRAAAPDFSMWARSASGTEQGYVSNSDTDSPPRNLSTANWQMSLEEGGGMRPRQKSGAKLVHDTSLPRLPSSKQTAESMDNIHMVAMTSLRTSFSSPSLDHAPADMSTQQSRGPIGPRRRTGWVGGMSGLKGLRSSRGYLPNHMQQLVQQSSQTPAPSSSRVTTIDAPDMPATPGTRAGGLVVQNSQA